MKKILLFIIIFIFTNIQVFAETSIELSISSTGITLEDEFELEIKIISDTDFKGGEVKVLGLDSFYQTSQNNTSQYTSINGVTKQTQIIKLGFFPNELGDFEIGPAFISDSDNENLKVIESNKIKIKVTEAINKDNNDTDKNDIKNNDNINNSFGKQNDEEINNGLKNIKNFNYSLKDLNYLFLLLIIVLILYYFYNKYFVKISDENNICNTETCIDYRKELIKKLRKLKKDGENIKKNIFYEKLNFIFREYFENIGINDSHTKTYEELSKVIKNENLLDLFKESYFNEFNTKKDDLDIRVNLIDNFIKEINK